MLTNQDIDECIVKAELEVDEMIEAALEDYFRPDVQREAEMLMADLPASVQAMVKERLKGVKHG